MDRLESSLRHSSQCKKQVRKHRLCHTHIPQTETHAPPTEPCSPIGNTQARALHRIASLNREKLKSDLRASECDSTWMLQPKAVRMRSSAQALARSDRQSYRGGI